MICLWGQIEKDLLAGQIKHNDLLVRQIKKWVRKQKKKLRFFLLLNIFFYKEEIK